MAAAAILDFKNFKFLTVETVKGIELRLQAKFRQNRSNHGWVITIFRFFQDGGRRYLGFLKFQIKLYKEEKLKPVFYIFADLYVK